MVCPLFIVIVDQVLIVFATQIMDCHILYYARP
jgi:hypothetical protein